MAIWQFRLDLVPRNALRSKFGLVPISIPQELAENFSWWSDIQPPSGFEARMGTILPEASSWSGEMRIWGDERGDTASVCYDSIRKIEWVGFRVDVRRLSLGFIREICRLASELECVLLTGTYQLVAPDEQNVLTAISRSRAKQYLEDPVTTLRSMKPTNCDVVRLPEEGLRTECPPRSE